MNKPFEDKPFTRIKDKFNNFAELARQKKEGTDYAVVVQEASRSKVAIVAPHGGNIEWHTGEMARKIAANDHSLYEFQGMGDGGGFENLHLTSIHFDEPRCLDLVAKTEVTLTIHGCRFEEPVVYLSGRDKKLESKLAKAFNAAGVKAVIEGHPYQSGKLPENICNRNRRGQGVQLEFSRGIRDNDVLREKCIRVVRETLKAA